MRPANNWTAQKLQKDPHNEKKHDKITYRDQSGYETLQMVNYCDYPGQHIRVSRSKE